MTPLVFRPRIVLINCVAWTIILPAVLVTLWFALPEDIRSKFSAFEIGETIFIFGFMLAIIWTVGLSYVRADAEGVRFRNGLRTHRVGWDEVESVKFSRHDPWVYLYTTRDVGRLAMLGIMRVDGERARRAAEALRQLFREHSAPE